MSQNDRLQALLRMRVKDLYQQGLDRELTQDDDLNYSIALKENPTKFVSAFLDEVDVVLNAVIDECQRKRKREFFDYVVKEQYSFAEKRLEDAKAALRAHFGLS